MERSMNAQQRTSGGSVRLVQVVPGRPKPPPLESLADDLTDLARLLRDDGGRALALADALSARGWPHGTLGDGSRSADSTTSVERAVGLVGDNGDLPRPGPWREIDERLVAALWDARKAANRARDRIQMVLAHASDSDPVPAGTGSCERCGRHVRSDAARNPEHRIKAGLCPSCYMAWWRARQTRPDLSRSVWLAEAHSALAEASGATSDRSLLGLLGQDSSLSVAEAARGRLADHDVDHILGNPQHTARCAWGHVCCSRTSVHTHFHPPGLCPECEEAA